MTGKQNGDQLGQQGYINMPEKEESVRTKRPEACSPKICCTHDRN